MRIKLELEVDAPKGISPAGVAKTIRQAILRGICESISCRQNYRRSRDCKLVQLLSALKVSEVAVVKSRKDQPTKGTVVYKDVDVNGVCYTVYVGEECVGPFLGDDPQLQKYIAEIGGEKNIKTGLDNR
jgi:hypothetical protein